MTSLKIGNLNSCMMAQALAENALTQLLKPAIQIRMVLKLPLRQTQGFIDYLLELMKRSDLNSPDYSTLSARTLGLSTPRLILFNIMTITCISKWLQQYESSLFG
ncbi:MAG: hypothetical protein GY920_22400 [Aliivibrio sp.]|nr:hypothetical protein [Aliivibrio sp.]